MGAPFPALVAAGVERAREPVGVPQPAGKKRDDHGDDRADAPHGAALVEAAAAHGLRVEDGRGLVGQRGNEAEHQAEHHGDLVGGQAEARKRGEHDVEAVRELGRRGGQQDERSHHEGKSEAHGVQDCRPHAAVGYADGACGQQFVARLYEDQVEQREEREEENERLDRCRHAPDGHAARGHDADGEGGACR